MPEPCPPADSSSLQRLRGLKARLGERVIGQVEALGSLADALLAGELGHTPGDRPRSFVLILGPTGSGKTRAVLEASGHLFGTRALARINLAEFASAERVPLLLGTRSGERGLLGEALERCRQQGGRILLLDEIEKAHRSVSDLFLGMEAAQLSLASGETVDLSAFHVLVTSNLGSQGAALEQVAYASLRRFVQDEACLYFRPEVFARFTEVIVFRPLGRDAQLKICEGMLEEELRFQEGVLSARAGRPVSIEAGPGVYRRLVNEGFHRTLGARPMRNVVERRVRAALVDAQLGGPFPPESGRVSLGLGDQAGLRVL